MKASAADLELQYDTSRAIHAALQRVAVALRALRAVTPKTAALTEAEQRITRAAAPLGQLFSAVEAADAATMPVVLEAWRATLAAVQAAVAEWEKMKAGPR